MIEIGVSLGRCRGILDLKAVEPLEASLLMRKLLHTLAAAGLVATPCVAARADLILVSPDIVTLGGTGLGAVNTVLTFQASGSATTEAGCVSFNGTTDVTGSSVSGGVCSGSSDDVKTGASQTQTRTLAEAGITSGSNFTVFFNAAEPSGNSITLNTLVASFYGADGTLLHSASFSGPHTFDPTATGTGNTGYLFALNSSEAATLQTFINNMGTQNIRVGIAASAADAAGGNETFFVFNSEGPSSAVPEPSTVALMATGLFGIAGVARRRRRS